MKLLIGDKQLRNVIFKGNKFTLVGDQGQDFFAYICNDCEPGFWIDMGSNKFDPPYDYGGNNTYGLYHVGWKGLSFDTRDFGPEYPPNTFYCVDCTDEIKMNNIFQERKDDIPVIVDYLSVDLDNSSYNGLKNIDFNEYKFKCMTIEHCANLYGDKKK